MKIFFLSYWFPYPPDNGARVRVFNFIKKLAAKHEVHLFSFLQEDSNPNYADILEQYCSIVSMRPLPKAQKSQSGFLSFINHRPHSVVASFNSKIYEAIRTSIINIQPDVIVVSMVDIAEYVTLSQSGIPSVLIDHNCEFGVIKRRAKLSKSVITKLRTELTWRKYAAWEAGICKEFDRVVMPNEEDKHQMQRYDPSVDNIHVIPNAADTDYYNPSKWSPDPQVLLYNGALSYSANYDAVLYYKEEIYPLLMEIYPEIQLYVTGRHETVNVDPLIECPGIKLTGYVKDMRDVLYQSAACVIPIRQGGGMRLKIPEAMAAGVPVISTKMGAEGLQCVHEKHLLFAETPEEFVTAICRILEENQLIEKLRHNARKLVEEQYSWVKNASKFVKLVESIAPNNLAEICEKQSLNN